MRKKSLQKTVFLIVFSWSIGGAEKQYASLAKECTLDNIRFVFNKRLVYLLRQQGFAFNNPNVIILDDLLTKPQRFGKLYRKILVNISFLYFFLQLVPHLRKQKPNILHLAFNSFWLANIPLMRSKYSIIITMVGNTGEALLKRRVRKSLKRGDIVECLNEKIKCDVLRSLSEMQPERVVVMSNTFIDYKKTYSRPKKNHVVFCARMIECKSPLLFVEMVKLLPETIKDKAKFLMLGAGPLLNEVTELASRYELLNRHLFIKGYVSNPLDYLSESIIFVHPTTVEPQPTQTMLEAMACENAVVCTDFEELKQFITPEVGRTCELSAEEFAKAVEVLLKQCKKTINMGKTARKNAMNLCNVSGYEEHLVKMYKNVGV
jgi:glycosyltransferase involved in cell wall biosynthesis